ncbi:alpha/beta hydrolase [Petropleomorpha daqingensis]|uniref:Acetyl esterase/lipase n=1 Tax=Petropleomorpha daqingensis TaxID=2026353 RepID=A0A853CAJ4_9ACTN|nr:alpha/beta hydrolase [Petropleomorpha daqingensis]NYJ04046.1 acetyl esterase/lipase [Petropleomorpha daqingensis]
MSPRMLTGLDYAPADPPGSRGHTLDLYLPGGDGPWPVLIACGGSAFLDDGGSYYAAELAPWFTGAGFAVAGVCTRSSGQARFPAQVHDVKAAIRWLRAHAGDHGLDPARFAIMGDSSGGWTAAMAGLAGDELEGSVGETRGSSRVQAVVDLYGPTDFLLMDAQMLPGACASFNELMGLTDCHDDPGSPESRLMGFPIQSRPHEVGAANPCTHVSADAPPFLIAHGQLDALVPHGQSEQLFGALAAVGAEATFFSVPQIGHDKGIVSPALPEAAVRSTSSRGTERETRPTLEAIERFLRSALG